MTKRWSMGAGFACAVLWAGGCDEAEPDGAGGPAAEDPLDWPVDERGPFRVGFRAWELEYEPLPGETRTIPLNLWYPTEAEAGAEVTYSGLQPADDVLGDAAPAPPAHDAGYPLMAYSHGDQGWGATSSDLMGWFASHGWLAIAPDHTDNVLFANADPTPQGHWYHRPLDVRAAVDALDALPDDDALAGQIDTSRWLVTGHSRGATTVWSLLGAAFDPAAQAEWCPDCDAGQTALFDALDDPRVVGGVAMAGTLRQSFFGTDGHRAVTVPAMSMTGTEDPVGQQEQWDAIDQLDFTWLDIEGACHQTFALGACETLEDADGYRIVDTYALAFGRHLVLGDDSDQTVGILDGSVVVDERVRFERKAAR